MGEATAKRHGLVLVCKSMNLFKSDDYIPHHGTIYGGELHSHAMNSKELWRKGSQYVDIPWAPAEPEEESRCADFMKRLGEIPSKLSPVKCVNPENYYDVLNYTPVYDFATDE